MDSGAVTGAFTVGGVLVGGLMTSTANYGLARRQERRWTRAASRLVLEEAVQVSYTLDAIVEHRRWRPIEFIDLAQWRANRATLAEQLRQEDWTCIVPAYEDLQRLLGWVEANTVTGDVGEPELRIVEALRDKFDHAIQTRLIQLSVHGPQRRNLARRYWALRSSLRHGHDVDDEDDAAEKRRRDLS
jgi:hypothetical protein